MFMSLVTHVDRVRFCANKKFGSFFVFYIFFNAKFNKYIKNTFKMDSLVLSFLH